MKLFFTSDLHGSLGQTQKVIKKYEESHADMLVLLGDILNHGPRNGVPDDYDPAAITTLLNGYKDKIICVRGNCDSEVDQMLLEFPILSDYHMIMRENGQKIFLTHGHIFNEEKLPELSRGDIFAYGHTHLPVADEKEGIYRFNPGSITFPKGGNEPSYGLLEEDGRLVVYGLDSGNKLISVSTSKEIQPQLPILDVMQQRYTTKRYDPSQKIPATVFAQLKSCLRYAPSSVNNQPWHFICATTDEAKLKLVDSATAVGGLYEFNRNKLINCSHVIALCSKTNIDDAYLNQVADQEQADGRYENEEAKQAVNKGRTYFTHLHTDTYKDAQSWMEKQLYIALGTLLISAASLGVDATPIEGFDVESFNTNFNLSEQGLSAVVLVALGYRDPEDFNAALPKSRFSEESLFTEI